MSIISVELMKKMDEIEMQKTTKQKEIKTERSKGNRSSGERVRAKWFYCAFKLGFLQLICKASLIFKSNLALALSIILKQRQLYEPTLVAVEYRCSKIWEKVLILFDMLINSSFNMMASFANIPRIAPSTSKFIY